MQNIAEFLLPDETCRFQTQPHWVIYSLSAGFALFTLATLFVSMMAWAITLMGLVATLMTGLAAAVTREFTSYVITNKRVFKKTGWLSRSTSGVLLDKIESVDVRQGILGRMLGYGDVLIHGTGGGVDAFVSLAAPFGFRRELATILSERE